MWKRMLLIVMAVVFALSFRAVASAVEPGAGLGSAIIPITPNALYTAKTDARISASGNNVKWTAEFVGYSGTTTKLVITVYLHKQGFLGLFWSDAGCWEATYSSYKYTFERTKSVDPGNYRIYAVFTAYSGTKSEVTTKYSTTVTVPG